jgi:hypothetical protein
MIETWRSWRMQSCSSISLVAKAMQLRLLSLAGLDSHPDLCSNAIARMLDTLSVNTIMVNNNLFSIVFFDS